MRAIPVTKAEAIFEPLWESGSINLTERFNTRVIAPARGRIYKGWFCVQVAIDHATPQAVAAVIERESTIDIEHYDLFRVQCRMPTWASIAVEVRIDGSWRPAPTPTAGKDVTEEVDIPISGTRIEGYRLRFSLAENRPAVLQLWWLGLANREAEASLAKQTSSYDSQWEGRLHSSAKQTAPSLGLLFGDKELEALRRKTSSGPLAAAMALLREEARRAMEIEPESQIGEQVPFPWHMSPKKERVGQRAFHWEMRILAFVGLVDGVGEYSQMAARMALSAAHCGSWTDNITGRMPGIPWHCRSFVEEVYCQGCALVLDWAGDYLTPFGAEVIRDAIVMKGLPRIESDFKRSEYIRSMNQGIVFSAGRILGTLALLPAWPRYAKLLDEAEADLFEMIDAYVLPDGGTIEGPSYWNYTFSNALPTLWALARYRGKEFGEYVPETVRRTARYGLTMMSSESDGLWYLPINDAHASQSYAPSLAAAYCRISDDPRWRALYGALIEAAPSADYHHLIMDPGDVGPNGSTVEERYDFLPETGQLDFVRKSDEHGFVQFHFSGGPTYRAHFDEDKGAFVLEAAGEVFAMDRGCCDYSHPESLLIGNADRHNLLFPEHDTDVYRQPPGPAYGAPIQAIRDGDRLAAVATLEAAWPEGLFSRNLRRLFSPSAGVYWIEDFVELASPHAMSFLLHTLFRIEVDGTTAGVRGTRNTLWIVPVDWKPSVKHEVLGVDSHLHPVNVLRMTSPAATSHRLGTLLAFAAPGAPCPVSHEGDRITSGSSSLLVRHSGEETHVAFTSPSGSGTIVFGPGAAVRAQ